MIEPRAQAAVNLHAVLRDLEDLVALDPVATQMVADAHTRVTFRIPGIAPLALTFTEGTCTASATPPPLPPGHGDVRLAFASPRHRRLGRPAADARLPAPGLPAGPRRPAGGLHAAGAEHGFGLRMSGEPSMWCMRIADDDDLMLHQEWVAECVQRGVFFTNHHNLFMNLAITDADIAHTLEVAHEAFGVVRVNHPELH